MMDRKKTIEEYKGIVNEISEQRIIEVKEVKVKYKHYIPEFDEFNNDIPKEILKGINIIILL